MTYIVLAILWFTVMTVVVGTIRLVDKVRPLLNDINEARQREMERGERQRQAAFDHIADHIRELNKQSAQVFRDQQIINDQHMESLTDIYATTLTALTNNQEIATQHLAEVIALGHTTVEKILEATVLMVNPIRPNEFPGEQPPLTPNFYESTVDPFGGVPTIPEPMFYDDNPDIPNEAVQITEPNINFPNDQSLYAHPSQMPVFLQQAFYGPGGLLNNGR